jgi:hypothetical protein
MSDEAKPTIFDLYAGESEPITLTDPSGRSVTVKFRKRTEAERRQAMDHANAQKGRYLEAMAERRQEMMAGPFSRLDKQGLVDARLAFMQVVARGQGLDLFDDLEPDDADPDAPETAEELDAQREERLQAHLDEQRKKLEVKTPEALLEELVGTAVQQEFDVNAGYAHMEKTISLTCLDADTDEPVFESVDQLHALHPEVLDVLLQKINEFLLPEKEKNARELASDPNSSRTTD